MEKWNKKILIIDAGSRQSLPLIYGFHNMGCKVGVYYSSKLDVGYVYRYTDEKYSGIVDMTDEEKTYRSMLSVVSQNSFDLVIPTSDFFATILSKHKDEFSKYANIYVNNWEIYSRAIDKLQTMRACMDNQIPCPKTSLINQIDDFDDDEWNYPIVVKPRTSFGAKGFGTANNYEELVKRFNLTEKKFGPSLVQEYIPQTDKQYQVEMLIDNTGKCKMFILMDKVRWYPVNGGSSTMNVTIHDDTIKANCIKLLTALKWRGYASLDIIKDPRDGVCKIMEINPRINGTAKICFASGINLSRIILQDAFDEFVDPQLDYPDGVGLRYFHMDVLWFLKSDRRFSTIPSWFSMKNTVDEIFEWKDLKPAFAYSIVAVKKLFLDNKTRNVE